jgi:hypothetical protein
MSIQPGFGSGLVIRLSPDLLEFPITTAPAMPVIQVRCAIEGTRPDPTPSTTFEWRAVLDFHPADCKNGVGTPPTPLQMSGSSLGGVFSFQFSELRGGRLTISVLAELRGQSMSAERSDLRIVGTNPLYTQLKDAIPSKVFRAITWNESRGRQFLGTANGGTSPCPLFSGDRKGGVGLTQLTRPAPTNEQIWNWRANITGGMKLFEEKKAVARGWPKTYREGTSFKALVDAYNAERAKAKQPAITITIPDFTNDQVELDALRGYNGWARGVHEFRAATDANGKLIVALSSNGKAGTASWVQVSATERTKAYDDAHLGANDRGDVDYVHHIMSASVPY